MTSICTAPDDRLPPPCRPEPDVLRRHLADLQQALDWAAVARMASPWVQAVRDNPPPFWAMESLLKEYPISSAEGLALMRLAEALLRVPDAETAIALTADQLGRADFEGAADATLARLSSTAIAMSKKFLPQEGQEAGLMARLGARTVVGATVRAVQLLGRQFVLGQTIAEALATSASQRRRQAGLRFSYDMLGEGARTDADARRYLESYREALVAIAAHESRQADAGSGPADRDGISIKLSALHPRYEHAQHERVMSELVPRVWGLCELAAAAGLNLTIDAEEVDRLELSLSVFEALAERVAQHCPGWTGLGLALQAYQTRSVELIAEVAAIARRHRLRFMCRLVKGAYWDAEIKRAQELGLPGYPVFTRKHHTDVSYLACAKALLDAADAIHPQFATHNAATIAAILQMARARGAPFELQRLHGMGEGVYREVLRAPAVTCRVYAPVGAHRDLLAYLVRRLLENGANSSFVHQLADVQVPVAELLQSPLEAADASVSTPSPLPAPIDLYGTARMNSAGVDLAVAAERRTLAAASERCRVPQVPESPAEAAPAAVARAVAAFAAWSHRPVGERASTLRHAADAMQRQLPDLCALLVHEAGKTWGDAVAEVREAIDFLRYYAAEAETLMAPVPYRAPPARAMCCGCTGGAPGSASAPGISRWPSLWARWRPRWSPATRCWPSRPNRRPAWPGWRSICCTPPVCPPMRCSCCTVRARPSAPPWSPSRRWPAWCSPVPPRWPS